MPSVKVKKLLIKHLFVTLGEWGNDQLEDLEQHLQVGAPRLGWEPLGWGGSPSVGGNPLGSGEGSYHLQQVLILCRAFS